MTRHYALLTAASVVALGLSTPALADSAQVGAGAATSTEVQAQQETGFFGSVGNTVKGWFSSDNDAAARAEMEQRPGSAGMNGGAQIDMDAQAETRAETAPAAGNDADSGTSAQGGIRIDTNSEINGSSTNTGAGGGVAVESDMGGGSAAGMGHVGVDATTETR